PPEVISHIFRFCTAGSLAIAQDPGCTPITLTAVCRYWRAVALSARELWARVAFFRCPPGSVFLLEAWLARSGNLPLSATI
ncbi:hypothetical protein DFH09DRAFT_892505, partial [Mycena vulgaris]